jgi:ketosteroid isomerase-like protein
MAKAASAEEIASEIRRAAEAGRPAAWQAWISLSPDTLDRRHEPPQEGDGLIDRDAFLERDRRRTVAIAKRVPDLKESVQVRVDGNLIFVEVAASGTCNGKLFFYQYPVTCTVENGQIVRVSAYISRHAQAVLTEIANAR